jgi:hypothetical protein
MSLVRGSLAGGYGAGYEGHYGGPSNFPLYCFSKEEAGQDDYLGVSIPKGVESRGGAISVAS